MQATTIAATAAVNDDSISTRENFQECLNSPYSKAFFSFIHKQRLVARSTIVCCYLHSQLGFGRVTSENNKNRLLHQMERK